MLSLKVGYSTLASSRVYQTQLSRLSTACVYFSICPASAEGIPVIRVPRSVQNRVENVKQTRVINKISTSKAGKLLIQGRNASLNQSVGYTHGKFDVPTLCSKGWKHKKSFGDYFTVNNIKSVAPFVSASKEEEIKKPVKTFHRLQISTELIETLERSNIIHPTTVQLQTIPKVMRGHNILCAAETGSGKTLSYLLPIMHKLQLSKEINHEASPEIRAMVVVPSRELAEQVASVSKTLCIPLGLETRTVGGGRGVGRIKGVFKRGVPDVLVATPGALVKALRRRCLDLSHLRFLVVDEADTMFDPSFSDMLEEILQHVEIASAPAETQDPLNKAQLLAIGATFPGGVGDVLSRVTDLGSIVVIKSKMLHFLMPHVKQTFLKVRGQDKVLELNHYLKRLQQEHGGAGGNAVLVFCNKSSTVNWLGYSLEEMGVPHTRIQGEMPAVVRTGIFHRFQKSTTDILLCTDVASRGLDTSRVRLVVNYDFPQSHTDYIHRAGRVGRAGGCEDGEVLSFVTHPWEVELVQKIETAARRRTSLPGMESAIREPEPKVVETEELS
ncbi:probable ATP-dependent RNA helicase DDX28 [Corythoichthys intestinalis]|uniref:probable ATP-dependent RNA helicase DDX28 n=1 Tax=Corythoichthys intestinalis TaxID=161448 RepID=UPI0025A5C897|nr:probable ATP-dependent RNA helicase DDX28 [Corythoichthys intestinalis]XP_061796470.1 probable ATP-dependent RNA helicase DDX28 [Nerophis lumbriciformis]